MTTVYALAVPARLSLDRFARQSNLHPVMVRRYVALGLLDCTRDAAGELWFSPPRCAGWPGCSGCTPTCP
ncbi:hypothetical protein ACFQY4_22840 [Catellatospora bangladeshensis]|uniref:hypothetical protein n=1 Tax=Catellatospora bangladeshensis TaxID=310355 RepID=UPI00360F9E9A